MNNQSGQAVAENPPYYIVAAARTPESTLVLKHNDVFAVFDDYGDLDYELRQAGGVFCKGTRFLSYCRLPFAGSPPLQLSATVRTDNVVLGVDLTNPDLHGEKGIMFPRGSLHIDRTQFLADNTLCQRIRISSFSQVTIRVYLTLEFGADFADIFEVRGTPRTRSGTLQPPKMEGKLVLGYEGLDDVVRRTVIRSPSHSSALSREGLRFFEELTPGAEHVIETRIAFESGVHPSGSCFFTRPCRRFWKSFTSATSLSASQCSTFGSSDPAEVSQ